MRSVLRSIRQFLSELRRRNVYQVAVTYVFVGVFVIEAADLTLTRLGLPGWTVTLVIVLVGLGFPIALVLAWALEMTPEGVRVEEVAAEDTDGSEEVPAPASTTREVWVGASVLVLLLLGAWWVWGGGAATETERTAATPQERSIAVLPFEVSGAGAENWRDGMVTMLSMNLDGAAGLRAISERTVLAAWGKRDSTGVETTLKQAVAVARDVGAEYAIVGSAVQLGDELRLGAEVRRVSSRNVVGKVEVEGAPGSITSLTDRLTREILGVLLDKSEEAIPSVDLASITTGSLDALRDYLEGERHFRAGEYEAALQDFEVATQEDSSFALAYARIATSRVMLAGAVGAGAQDWARAYEASDRLPARERGIVRAWHLLFNQDRGVAAADTLRRLSERYPDDPSVWFALGEALWHSAIPNGLPEADRAFQRALDLDPGVAIYHIHPIDLAFRLHRDSALAARRIAAAPDTREKSLFRLAKKLVFGGPTQRKQVLARLDTIDLQFDEAPLWPIHSSLAHPTDGALHEQLLLRIRDRGEIERETVDKRLAFNRISRGQLEKGLSQLQEQELGTRFSRCVVAQSMSLGLPIPDSDSRRVFEVETLPADPSAEALLCTGIYLIEQGRDEEVDLLIDRIKETGRQSGGPDRSEARRMARELEGYRAFRAGDLTRAERLLANHNESTYPGAIWRGDLYRKLGKLEGAEGWYLGAWRHPVAHERLGQLYQEMDKPEKAAAAYERFIAAWTNADPALQPRVEAARERRAALGNPTAEE